VTVTTAGLDELGSSWTGAPGRRAIRDGSVDVPLPDAATMQLVGRRRGEILQRRRVRSSTITG
jgi:hypothetical protein